MQKTRGQLLREAFEPQRRGRPKAVIRMRKLKGADLRVRLWHDRVPVITIDPEVFFDGRLGAMIPRAWQYVEEVARG